MRDLLFVIIISLTHLYFSCEVETTNQEFTFHDLKIEFLKEDNSRIMVSNIKTDSILIQLNLSDCKNLKFYDLDGRLIYLCVTNEQKEVWEIEAGLSRTMMLDLTENDLIDLKELR